MLNLLQFVMFYIRNEQKNTFLYLYFLLCVTELKWLLQVYSVQHIVLVSAVVSAPTSREQEGRTSGAHGHTTPGG